MTPTSPLSSGNAEAVVIDQRYRILDILGEGNSGTTYLAEPTTGGDRSENKVALQAP